MVVTIVCRDTISCKVTIVLCNGALMLFSSLFRENTTTIILRLSTLDLYVLEA